MAAEDTAADTAKPHDFNINAQAAEDAAKMLAELQGEMKAETGETKEDQTTSEDKQPEKPEDTQDGAEDTGNPQDITGGDRGYSPRGRGGSYQWRNYRDNIKSELVKQEESSDPDAIRKQVEFYFSDANLPMDKFLLTKVGGSKNYPVELKIIHSFKRMRHFQPFEVIVKAMKDSTILELVEDDTAVRRRDPLPESLDNGPNPNAVQVFEDRAMPRSLYAKGFGEEAPSTQFDIEAFFAPYGPTNAIRLRRNETKTFKGSVFVEFADKDLQEKFLSLDPKPQYKGQDLQIMSKKEYCDGKVEDIKSGKIQPNNKYPNPRSRGGGSDRYNKRKRDDEDNRDWRERRDDDRRRGFRDDKRGGRPRRGSPDYRAGGRNKPDRVERDERGVPVVKTSESPEAKAKKDADSKVKREAASADALAKAKAMVAAEEAKLREIQAESAPKENGSGVVAEAEAKNEPAVEKIEKVESQKEENGEEGELIAKKPETKTKAVEAETTNHAAVEKVEKAESKKHAREEDGEGEEPAAKKANTKTEAVEAAA